MYRSDAATRCFISYLDQSRAQDPTEKRSGSQSPGVKPDTFVKGRPFSLTPCQLESHLSAPVIPRLSTLVGKTVVATTLVKLHISKF